MGIIKVGGDIRDAVPALYLIKEPIKDYSSIRIWGKRLDTTGGSGSKRAKPTISSLSKVQ